MTSYQIFQIHLMLTAGTFFMLLSLLLIINKNLYDRRKPAIIGMEFSAAALLFIDSFGLIFDGQKGIVARYCVWINSFLAFIFILVASLSYVSYVNSKMFENYNTKKIPRRVYMCKSILLIGIIMVCIFGVSGHYFYVDDNNNYCRGPLFLLSYMMPILGIMILITVIIQYRKNVSTLSFVAFITYALLPQAAGVLQVVFLGEYFLDLSFGIGACFLYGVYIVEQNKATIANVSIDVKTGLYNCNGFVDRIIELSKTHDMTDYDIYYLELIRFSNINRKYGNEVSDEIIRSFVNSLRHYLSTDEVLGRLGGNYFVAYVNKTKREEFLNLMGEGIEVEFEVNERTEKVVIASAVGGYSIEEQTTRIIQLIDLASMALNLAKHTYKVNALFMTPEIKKELYDIQNMEQRIAEGLEKHEFIAYYQPKVNSKELRLYGAEALVRWERDGKIIPPGAFIPIMEKNEMICKLDFYMLNRVCQDMLEWIEKGYAIPRVSINFSRKNLGNKNLAKDIFDVIRKYNLAPGKIEIEITETLDEYPIGVLKEFVEALHRYGIRVAVDDFGVGSSSMNLLREVSFDVLKIDKTFVDNSTEKEVKILKHIVDIAKDTGAHVIAEGVERREQCDVLSELGCEEIQGYVFDKPMNREMFEERLRTNNYQ